MSKQLASNETIALVEGGPITCESALNTCVDALERLVFIASKFHAIDWYDDSQEIARAIFAIAKAKQHLKEQA